MATVSANPGAGIAREDLCPPPEIESATAASSAAVASLQERWPPLVELSIATQASIYHSYPYLFLEAFPSARAERLKPLCLAASLFADSLFLADDLMDENPSARNITINVLRIQAMQFEGYRILHGLFPPQARFWERFRDYLALYAQACLDELRFTAPGASWGELNQDLALRIAKGKSSLAKFVVAGLGELAADEAPVEPLTRALDRYYIARQMVDDLSDWRQDLARGCPSLLLARVAAELSDESKDKLRNQPERVGRAIYAGGHARYTMELALHALAGAKELSNPHPAPLWQGVLARMKARCETLLGELDRIAGSAGAGTEKRPQKRFEIALPSPEDAWQETAWAALGFLLKRWQPGAARGASGEAGERRWRRAAAGGGVLTRALVADALFDADELLGGQLRPLIEGEANFLLEHRLRTGIGGWGWAAVSPGLPPDSDHLGRVLRVLVRLGWLPAVEEHCGPPLAILLEQAVSDGALPTWIGRVDDPPGGGPDEAVMASLLTSLDLYDRERFRPVVDRGAAWLEARQKSDGSWTSPGIQGPYLPTAACVELLAADRPGSRALARAAAFLRRSQSGDGGWGLEEGRTDALSTALALLALARSQRLAGEEEDFRRACRGRDLLLRTARFNAAAPAEGGVLTAAFALQAAIAWHRLERRAAELSELVAAEVTP